MRTTSLFALLAFAASLPAQETRDPLTSLQARSRAANELPAFSARYELETPEMEEKGSLHLTYLAPDRGSLHFEAGGQEMRTGIDAGAMFMVIPAGPAGAVAEVDLEGLLFALEEARRPFRERLGTQEPEESGAFRSGMHYTLDFSRDAQGELLLNFNLTWVTRAIEDGVRRTPLLAWLERFAEEPYEAGFDGEVLTVAYEDSVQLLFEPGSVFPDRVERDAEQGPKRMELVAWSADPSDVAFSAPDLEALRAEGWKDQSLAFGLQLFQRYRLSLVRDFLEEANRAGVTAAELRGLWRELAHAFHGAAAPILWEPWERAAGEEIARLKSQLAAESEEWGELDEEQLAGRRRKLRTTLLQQRDRMLVGLQSVPAQLAPFGATGGGDRPPAEELLESEKQAAREELESRLGAPFRARFEAELLEPFGLGDDD